MKHYKTVQVPAQTKEELDKITCDLCGAEAKRGYWNSTGWDVAETEMRIEVRQKDGTAYPEGGIGTEYNADICPDCFKDKLIPWLDSQGCTAKREDWDY